ncbi:MAG TPA: hypothetical protein VMT12_07800 [Syntrophales bacterium]|nr:hypothetical protein [Syntrophales bacterium]
MSYDYSIPEKKDTWGRRSGIERRMVSLPLSVPDRRSNQERRRGQDRRMQKDPYNVTILRRSSDMYMEFANTMKGIFLAALLSLPLWALIIFLIFIKR